MMDNKEKDIVNDGFGNVEESYDVPVYEPITNNDSVVKEDTVEEIPVIEDIEPVTPIYTEEVPAFEENAPVEAIETPVYTNEVEPVMEKVESVEPIQTEEPTFGQPAVQETAEPVEKVQTDVPVEEPTFENPTVEYNYDVKPEVEEQPAVAPVPLEPNYEEEVPFTEDEMSNGVEHPDAKITLQKEEVKEEVSNEDLKISLNDNASLKFVLIIGIIIFIAIMVLPLTNLI